MRELRPLRLPQLVEARKKEDDIVMDSPVSASSGLGIYLTQTVSSDLPSPLTPTSSTRGHSRFPSSTSSLPSSPVVRESMDGFAPCKTPLTDVKEEPQERDDDYDMVDSFRGFSDDRSEWPAWNGSQQTQHKHLFS